MKRLNNSYKDKTSEETVVDNTVDKLLDSIIDEHIKIFGETEINSEE